MKKLLLFAIAAISYVLPVQAQRILWRDAEIAKSPYAEIHRRVFEESKDTVYSLVVHDGKEEVRVRFNGINPLRRALNYLSSLDLEDDVVIELTESVGKNKIRTGHALLGKGITFYTADDEVSQKAFVNIFHLTKLLEKLGKQAQPSSTAKQRKGDDLY